MSSSSASSTSDDIRLFTTPTREAYLRFQLWWTLRAYRMLLPFAALLTLAFLFAPMLPLPHQGAAEKYRASVGLLILPALIIVPLILQLYIARKRWQSVPELRAPRTYVFNRDAVTVLADSFNSTIAWEHIVTADQFRDQLLLGTAQNQFYLVPLRDFASEEQLNCLRTLINHKVPRSKL